jgi:hypothetical protein
VRDLSSAVIVDFPLRGEWRALNTPAERVPSHGTDFFAQRFAFDFVQMDPSGAWYYPGGVRDLWRHVTIGLAASRFFCWDQPVHSAFAGRVLAARDGWPDRERVQLGWELLRATIAPPTVARPGDDRPLAGNYVVVEGPEGFALYAHLRRGSVRVRAGQRLVTGDVVGAVGNSGNSTMPHLHFHLMDGPDALTAHGLPCACRGYERWTGTGWEPVARGVPGLLERIRAS